MKYAIYNTHTWTNDHSLSRVVYKIVAAVAKPRDLIGLWCARNRARREIARLDPRILRDIGVSEYDAWLEGSKSFWKP